MTLPNLPEVPQNATLEQLTQIVAEMSQQLTYLLSGFLSSQNAREFGGWQVGNTELQAKTKTVGMSTAVTAGDDIRFWAGDVKTGAPNFKVTESGKLTAVQASFLSSTGYPKITLNQSADSLLTAAHDATHYISISPDFVGGAPGLVWQDPASSAQMFIINDGSGDFMLNPSQKLKLNSSSGDVELKCAAGHVISVNSWNELYNRFNGQSMQTALNAKANTFSGASGTVYVASSSGGSPTTAITFSNGIRTS